MDGFGKFYTEIYNDNIIINSFCWLSAYRCFYWRLNSPSSSNFNNSLSNLLEICGFRIIKFNRYYDENDLVVVAQKKNKKNHRPNIRVDNLSTLTKFFKEWEKNSKFLKDLF